MIPPSETGPNVIHRTEGGEVYQVTRNPKKKQSFTLWRQTESGFEKLASATSPYDFYGLLYGSSNK